MDYYILLYSWATPKCPTLAGSETWRRSGQSLKSLAHQDAFEKLSRSPLEDSLPSILSRAKWSTNPTSPAPFLRHLWQGKRGNKISLMFHRLHVWNTANVRRESEACRAFVAWPEGSLAVVVGLTVGRFAVVILLANVGLLALAQSAQRWCHGSSSRNAAGTEKGADVCSRGEKQVRALKDERTRNDTIERFAHFTLPWLSGCSFDQLR